NHSNPKNRMGNVEEDEFVDNLSDASEKSDNVEEQDHSTSSECSFESGSTSSEEEADEPPPPKRLRPRRFYSGRDCTRWYMEVPEQGALQRQVSLYNVRRDGVNTDYGLRGVRSIRIVAIIFHQRSRRQNRRLH
ncbi:hypothetical protein U1Q18_050220, partial [Sarracenia purpurea var. burkii]